MKSKFRDTTHSKKCGTCGNAFYRDKRCTWKYWEKAKFCSRECSSIHVGKIFTRRRKPLESLFWDNVEKKEVDECWPWSAARDRDGYGLISYLGKSYRANRLALKFNGVDIPKGHHACHRCRNSWCCNPNHLYAGTAAQNNMDKYAHGTNLSGEQCHMSKLTEKQVIEIRKDTRSRSVIASEHGVTHSNICAIQARRTWKHLP